ncbi:MAG TPA: DUF3592 domain-containing protein [Rhodocyclaceae bacterium]
MRLLLSVLFVLGALLLGWSVRDLISAPSADEIRRERAAMAAWPSVSGDLREIRLQQVKSTGRGQSYFEAAVSYRYLVDGVVHEGSRLGVQDFREDTAEALESRLSIFFSPANVVGRKVTDTNTPIWNEQTIALQLANQPVTVYYDPAKPDSSILDPQDRNPITTLDLLAPHLALIPIGSLLMIVSFLRWRQRSGVTVTRPQKVKQRSFEINDKDWFECGEIGDSLLQQQAYKEALAAYERAYAESPGEAGTFQSEIRFLLCQAECLIGLSRDSEAEKLIDKAISGVDSRQGAWADEIRDQAASLRQAIFAKKN